MDKINTLLEKASINPHQTIHPDNVQTLSLLLDDFFTEPDTHFIRSLQRGNCGTMLVTSGEDLLVLKEHLHEEGNWIIPFNVLNDIASTLYFFQKNSPFLPKLVSLHIGKHSTRIISQFIPLAFEDIFDHPLPFTFLKKRFWELLMAIDLLHKHGFAHRDIKPENIRLHASGQLVLIDFDTCCRRANNHYFTRPACTPTTRAPELENDYTSSYDATACDIFAAGCVMYAMAMDARLPFLINPWIPTERLVSIRRFQPSQRFIHRVGENGASLIQQMLQENPYNRPSVSVLLQDKFFS